MSEHIVHTAVTEDAFRIATRAERVNHILSTAMRDHASFAELAGVTRKGDLFTVDLLTRSRAATETGSLDDAGSAKLAFTLGWLCHRATDRQMKPVFRELEPGRPVKPAESSIYQEAHIFRTVYAADDPAKYPHAIFDIGTARAAAGFDIDGIRELIRATMKRALIELHTFIPDTDDVESWLENLYERQQQYKVDVERYAQAIINPDPDKVKKYIVDANFFSADEPILRAARKLRRDEPITKDEVNAAVESDADSHYAHAVKRSVEYIDAANAFFDGKLDLDGLNDRLDIGKKGRDGGVV